MWRKIMNSKFKIDDYVKYTSNRYCDSVYNPLWGGKYGKIVGRVYEIRNYNSWVRVNWGNGTKNNYIDGDLEFYCTKKSRPNCFKCKKRLQCITQGVI